jgi:hypothetical protein
MKERGMSRAASSEPVFFSAFEWPLPVFFSAAVAACRFEQGDVLYRDSRAYADWSRRVPKGSGAIQVLDPPRSARGTLLDSESDRRQANWASEVRILLVDPATGDSEERSLSQGKLLMALWMGDESWLDVDRPQPDFPGTARDLQARLEDVRSAVARLAASSRARSGCQFILVVDLASDSSRAKAQLVEDQLSEGGSIEVVDLLPTEAGIGAPGAYHPTLVLRVFTLAGRDVEGVESALRECLYQGGASRSDTAIADAATGDASAPADRFSIGRHGLLVSF